jgi:hypothetical protein
LPTIASASCSTWCSTAATSYSMGVRLPLAPT